MHRPVQRVAATLLEPLHSPHGHRHPTQLENRLVRELAIPAGIGRKRLGSAFGVGAWGMARLLIRRGRVLTIQNLVNKGNGRG